MKTLNDYTSVSISSENSRSIYGGMKPLKTELKHPETNEVIYKDVHHDNDNNGEWSCGDTFEMTPVQ